MPKFFTSIILFILFIFLGNLVQIYACSCIIYSACQRYNSSSLIFVGRAVDKKSGKIADVTGKEIDYGIESTMFEVSETISGETNSKVSIHNKSGNSCDTSFADGETYLIFANGNAQDGFTTQYCSGNLMLAEAGETLADLGSLKNIDNGGKLYGQIFESIFKRDSEYVPMPGVELKIQEIGGSGKIYNAAADGDGKYELILPEGKYKITPKIPPFANFDEDANDPVFLRNRGCAQKILSFKNDAQLSGKVLDASGKPVKDIRIELVAVDNEDPSFAEDETAYSKETGEFIFTNIPAGNYTMSVNFTSNPDEDIPFPTTFFPKTAERKNAKVFNVGLGESIENITFRLPPRIKSQTITGTVVFPDGTKAAGMTVNLQEKDSVISFSHTTTDADGNFKLNGFAGESYNFGIEYYGDETEKNNYTIEKTVFILKKNIAPVRLVLKNKSPD